MSKILIIGAKSFVGKNYQQFSLNDIIDEVSLLEQEPESINYEGYDAVLHLVAIVHQTKTIPEKEYFKVNKELAVRAAMAAKAAGVKQFVFLSTVKVYGDSKTAAGILNESSECSPNDSYGKSKYAAEIALKELENDNFTVSIVRTPLVYGEEVKANMLSLIKLIHKFPILPLGNIKNKRSFTSVRNLSAYIDRIIELRVSGVFIAKDLKNISTTELVRILKDALGRRVYLLPVPGFVSSLCEKLYPKIFNRLFGDFTFENEATIRTLKFTPPETIEDGLKYMILRYSEKSL
jgi:UDP-glucose 4-epimerase